jgi:ATP-dependent Lon protease
VLIAQDKAFKPEIEESDLLEILGPKRFEIEGGVDVHIPGVVTGLAWTEFGGVTMIIESSKMRKVGNEESLKYTGRLGDVMQESIQVAWDIARQHLSKRGVDLSFLQNTTVHLHVPEGAISKDGPSAGAAMTTVLISLLSNRPVRRDLAMTGEITLRGGGTILPVGGIKEKLLAAHRAGYKHVLIPSRNAKDLVDIPEDVKQEMEIKLVEIYDDVFKVAFE